MSKLSLDQFLRNNQSSNKKTLFYFDDIDPVDRNGEALIEFLQHLHNHCGIYEIDQSIYDSVIFTGSDNIYFSYEFNSNSGNALAETLFILSSLQISKTSDNSYELRESNGSVSILTLRI